MASLTRRRGTVLSAFVRGRPGDCFVLGALCPRPCAGSDGCCCAGPCCREAWPGPRESLKDTSPCSPAPVTGCSLGVASAGAAPAAAAALSTAIRRAGWAGMCLARAPKRSVLSVSWASTAALDTHRMSTVWLPGPSTSCSSRVSLLDLFVARARGARVGVRGPASARRAWFESVIALLHDCSERPLSCSASDCNPITFDLGTMPGSRIKVLPVGYVGLGVGLVRSVHSRRELGRTGTG